MRTAILEVLLHNFGLLAAFSSLLEIIALDNFGILKMSSFEWYLATVLVLGIGFCNYFVFALALSIFLASRRPS